ncbi:hypothetical protein [Herpetosiphon llansteffanensis]|uniref:hypothetical protein n=1 Tax=Herpetosiphon llansteffanensis TaxID=2094568 RepID=UPI000D7CDD72|nr:hypothetical protein [Herpetosiphon llansteffanensis]
MRKIYIMDTSVLCVYLKIPGKDTCGSNDIFWDYSKADQKIQEIIRKQETIVLPLATIIETGNHIAQIKNEYDRNVIAMPFLDILKRQLSGDSPWIAFTEHTILEQQLQKISEMWKGLAKQKISFGDAMILYIANYYRKMKRFEPEILTGDRNLKNNERLDLNISRDPDSLTPLVPRPRK